MDFKIGDTVYYIKESYGKHVILDITTDEVLLGTPKLNGVGMDKFWTTIYKIFHAWKQFR